MRQSKKCILKNQETLMISHLCFMFYKQMSIQSLRQENKKLKELHASCEDELEKLRETGKNHEAQIDTLLKFNERLLGIIQNEFNSAAKNRISSDLQIIAQDNEAPELPVSQTFKNKLGGQEARIRNFEQHQMDGFEEDDEEQEEIYNQEKSSNLLKSPNSLQITSSGLAVPPGKNSKLDKVFEMQNKEMEVSVNLSSSAHNSFGSSIKKDPRQFIREEKPQKKERPQSQYNAQIQQIKEMIKQYKEEFQTNSAEYQQICTIIHNDLLNDLEQFNKLEEESRTFFQDYATSIDNLRADLSQFKPVNQLIKIMTDLNVPENTQRLLQHRIINKHM